MEMRSALARPVLSRGQRIVVVDLLTVVITLGETHGMPVADVYCGEKNHGRRGRRQAAAPAFTSTQILAKLASMRSPCVLDFSGWNCAP